MKIAPGIHRIWDKSVVEDGDPIDRFQPREVVAGIEIRVAVVRDADI